MKPVLSYAPTHKVWTCSAPTISNAVGVGKTPEFAYRDWEVELALESIPNDSEQSQESMFYEMLSRGYAKDRK